MAIDGNASQSVEAGNGHRCGHALLSIVADNGHR